MICMAPQVSFGKRKITQVNYSRCVSLPKLLLQNMDIDVDDYLEFLAEADGAYRIRPVKRSEAEATAEGEGVK